MRGGTAWKQERRRKKNVRGQRGGDGITVKPLEAAQVLSPAALMIAALSM